MGGAIKMMEDLTCEERLRERSMLHLGENHPGGALHVCVLGNIVAADKLAPLLDGDGMGRGGFISTGVTWLVGWRGHPMWRTSS